MRCTYENLKGVFTALVTPFTEDGKKVDFESLSKLVSYQLKVGVHGFVLCGSTGEAATLNDTEYSQVISHVCELTKGLVLCIAGVNSSSTTRACELAKLGAEAGADGILLVAPPYNKPPQEGILAHFEAVSSETSLPVVAYNIPGRTSVNITPATLGRLAEGKIIIGIKESSGSMDQVMDILSLLPPKISLLSGEDSLVISIMASGGRGVISAVANVIPELFVDITEAALGGDWNKARASQFKALPFVRAMFLETNPIPIKFALSHKGIIKSSTVRLPLCEAKEETKAKIRATFNEH